MINLLRVKDKLTILENKTNEEKEKLIYEWIKNHTITLGEFRTLLMETKKKE